MDIDPRRIRDFLRIVENGTFTEAAKHLHISQPALSNSIRILEENLGVKLLKRDRNGAQPTEYGEMLADSAVVLESILHGIVKKIENRKAGATGSLSIGVSPIAASSIVPEAIATLISQSPSVSMRIEEGTETILVEKLFNMEIDLIVGSVGAGRAQPDIADIRLFKDDFCIISRPGNPLTKGKSVTLKKLQNAHWVMPDRGDASKSLMTLHFRNADLAMPENIVDTNSIIAVKKLVAASDCVSLMPSGIAAPEKAAGILNTVRLRDSSIFQDTGVRTIKGRQVSQVAQNFISELQMLANGRRETPRRKGLAAGDREAA